MRHPVFGVAAAVLVLAAGISHAQDADLGRQIFEERCAVCHGAGGAGDGMVGELFAAKPKDLKLLGRENGGVYPFDDVYRAIDGRTSIAAHGNSEMPVWGRYFMEEAIDNPAINDKNARYITEGRVLALVYYLQTLQVE